MNTAQEAERIWKEAGKFFRKFTAINQTWREAVYPMSPEEVRELHTYLERISPARFTRPLWLNQQDWMWELSFKWESYDFSSTIMASTGHSRGDELVVVQRRGEWGWMATSPENRFATAADAFSWMRTERDTVTSGIRAVVKRVSVGGGELTQPSTVRKHFDTSHEFAWRTTTRHSDEISPEFQIWMQKSLYWKQPPWTYPPMSRQGTPPDAVIWSMTPRQVFDRGYGLVVLEAPESWFEARVMRTPFDGDMMSFPESSTMTVGDDPDLEITFKAPPTPSVSRETRRATGVPMVFVASSLVLAGAILSAAVVAALAMMGRKR